MSEYILKAMPRTQTGKQLPVVRRAGQLPAVLYGHNVKNTNVAVSQHEFEQIFKRAGGSSLIELRLDDGQPCHVIVQETQRDPVSNQIIHVDFRQVNMEEKITAEVSLSFVGESKAMKELGGTLVRALNTVEIECLPQHLVREITVDITPLQSFDQFLRVKDLVVPEGITILDRPDTVVANVQAPRTEEELKELEGKVEEKVDSIEQVEKPKKEEAEEAEAATDKEAPKKAK